jgi:ribonuclease HI
MKKTKKKYYAYVLSSQKFGIVDDWNSCEKIVSGQKGARYRGFDTKEEASRWLLLGANYETKEVRKLDPGIYFDAGTGRGNGVEISVTDEKGKDLLHKAISKDKINNFGKHLIQNNDATNNYGELLAFYYALIIAEKENVKNIFGDSRLVIDYWSKWKAKQKELKKETVDLIHEVAKMRENFEKNGGTVKRISGDHNPADLGFHK